MKPRTVRQAMRMADQLMAMPEADWPAQIERWQADGIGELTITEATMAAQLLNPPDQLDLSGQMLNHWRVIKWLGGGGMADIWLAEHATDPATKQVAIKVPGAYLRSAETTEQLTTALRREHDLMESLQHVGHVPRVRDFGRFQSPSENAELPFLAMSYIHDAKPIVKYVRDNALDVYDRVVLIRDAAEILGAVHKAQTGFVHRDITAANLVVGSNSQTWLIDLGLSETTQEDELPERRQSGSLEYLCPEQAAHENQQAAPDRRWDIYALGVLAYEILAEHRPYEINPMLAGRPAAELAAAIRGAERLPLFQAAKSVDRTLSSIVMKAMSREIADRFGSASELADALTRWMKERHRMAQPVSAAVSPPTQDAAPPPVGKKLVQNSFVRSVVASSWGWVVAVTSAVVSAIILESYFPGFTGKKEAPPANPTEQLAQPPAHLPASKEATKGDSLAAPVDPAPAAPPQMPLANNRPQTTQAATAEIPKQKNGAASTKSIANKAIAPIEQRAQLAYRSAGGAAEYWWRNQAKWTSLSQQLEKELSKLPGANLVISLVRQGDFKRAEQLLNETKELPRSPWKNLRLAELAWLQGHYSIASQRFSDSTGSLPTAAKSLRAELLDSAAATASLAGNEQLASEHWQEAIAVRTGLGRLADADRGRNMLALVESQLALGKNTAALDTANSALLLLRRTLNARHPDIAMALLSIANAHQQAGRFDKAAYHAAEAAAFLQQSGFSGWRQVDALSLQADAQQAKGDGEKSLTIRSAAIKAAAKIHPTNTILLGEQQMKLARQLQESGAKSASQQTAREATRSLRPKLGENHAWVVAAAQLAN